MPSASPRAAERLSGVDHVVLEHSAIPDEWPRDSFDLVVFSEIAYYFDASTLTRIVERLAGSTSTGRRSWQSTGAARRTIH